VAIAERAREHAARGGADLIDLARGLLHVRQSKTHAGVRDVTLMPLLRDELAALKAAVSPSPDDPVFTTRNGTPQTRHNIRRRVLLPAVARANAQLADVGAAEINPRLTTHSLRHTFASLLFEADASVPYVMGQLGHSDPAVTLSIYAHVLRRKSDIGDRFDALIGAAEWARMGTNSLETAVGHDELATIEAPETA
jgi:integrase